jgi:hypothetical protein
MEKKIKIEYYVQHIYGVPREKFANKAQEDVFQRLTGRKTLDSISRELIRDLTSGAVTFEQVLIPNPLP